LSSASLAGKVIALIGTGTDTERRIAMACAEAGADLALGTRDPGQPSEFGMNSIANEAWVVGAEQFVRVLDAGDRGACEAFVEETWARYGGCDAFIATADGDAGAAAAFTKRMARTGHGVLVLCGAEIAMDGGDVVMKVEVSDPGLLVTTLAAAMESGGR
jgi:NAD(P)-dependent dehydrogenase (short-subunit alcohol dehydrogenase family)